MNPLALQDVDNEMLRDADEYLRKHKILELFEVGTAFTFSSALTPGCYVGPDDSDRLQVA